LNNARTLLGLADLKLLVVACNTASAVSLPALSAALSIPVIGVIEPGARAAALASRGGDIAVLGTAGTVRSGAYPRALRDAGCTQPVHALACPLFVPLVEEGILDGPIPPLVAARYLSALPATTDAVVLGCTHYPLLEAVLRAALPETVALVDGAQATAREISALLTAQGLRREHPRAPTHRIFVTDAPEQMGALAPRFLGRSLAGIDVELVDVVMT